MAWTFEGYVLDPARRELRHGASFLVKVEPQVFDLLAYLVTHCDRVVGKDELLEAVWKGRTVSDAAVTTRINAARQAVGDNGRNQRLIRTVPRRGVRFVAKVLEVPPGSASSGHFGERGEFSLLQQGALPLPDRPSIAVLPFSNLSGDQAPDYLADGMAEDLITALSKLRWFFVIARNSTAVYKEQSPDVRQVGRELGVRYVLAGSVRKNGGCVRIVAQLVDARSARSVWAERYDRDATDM